MKFAEKLWKCKPVDGSTKSYLDKSNQSPSQVLENWNIKAHIKNNIPALNYSCKQFTIF